VSIPVEGGFGPLLKVPLASSCQYEATQNSLLFEEAIP